MPIMNPQTFANMLTSFQSQMPEAGEKETDIAYAHAMVGQAAKAYGKVSEALNKINGDEDISDAGKAKQSAKTVNLYVKPLVEDLLKAQARIKERSQIVVTTINTLPELTDQEKALGAEIRNHCKSLSTGEALDLLQQAQKAGDMLTIRSLLHGPAYLTGLPPDLLDQTRTTLQESLSPSETVQRGRLDETLNVLNIVTDNLQRSVIEYEAASPEPIAA